MRHEPSFLKDILSACHKIEATVAATSEDLFLRDEVLSAAVLHHLTVIGEAINRLSAELRERHPEVPWRQIIAVRRRIVHAISIWIGRSSGRRPLTTFPNSGDRFSTSSRRSFRNPNPIESVGPGRIRTRKQRACWFGSNEAFCFQRGEQRSAAWIRITDLPLPRPGQARLLLGEVSPPAVAS